MKLVITFPNKNTNTVSLDKSFTKLSTFGVSKVKYHWRAHISCITFSKADFKKASLSPFKMFSRRELRNQSESNLRSTCSSGLTLSSTGGILSTSFFHFSLFFPLSPSLFLQHHFLIIYSFIYLCVYACMKRSEGSMQLSVLSDHVGFRDKNLVVGLGTSA